MFGLIARRYDLANDILSLGVHRRWRRQLLSLGGVAQGDRVLDCATGTGDVACALRRCVGIAGYVAGIDPCVPMLDLARVKAQRQQLAIEFTAADVLALPYAAASFDAATIAFGIRNVSTPAAGLAEMARVVRPGGRVLVLEFGQPRRQPWRGIYTWYARHIIPRVGGWITGQPDAYQYLHDTSAAFPSGAAFVALMRGTGCFSEVQDFPLLDGVAYIYRGVVRG